MIILTCQLVFLHIINDLLLHTAHLTERGKMRMNNNNDDSMKTFYIDWLCACHCIWGCHLGQIMAQIA